MILISGSLLRSVSAEDGVTSFAVASIKPSQEQVKFEHDGKTEISPSGVKMRDVTVATCIKWAYSEQDSQIIGPAWLQSDHFDIDAKADGPVAVEQLKLMMRSLLADRFQFTYHSQERELRAYVLTTSKSGHKLHQSASDASPLRENSAVGTVARAITMLEFADFIAGPLQTPVLDQTGLKGRYDFVLDFTPYVPTGERAMKPDYDNTNGIIISAMQSELGLKLDSKKEMVKVMVIDRVEKPSGN